VTTRQLKTIELDEVHAKALLWEARGGALWGWVADTLTDGSSETWTDDKPVLDLHHPADRCGMPYRVHDVDAEELGDRWFLFSTNDSHFPIMFVVRAEHFEAAYERLGEWKEAYFKIEERFHEDYDDPDFNACGVQVDMSRVIGEEVSLRQIYTDNERTNR